MLPAYLRFLLPTMHLSIKSMKFRNLIPSLLAITACLSQQLLGMYMQVETQDVPLERLIVNITDKAKAEPANAEALHQLARIHAIAYSNKLGEADPVKSWTGWQKKDPEQPWLGYQPPHVPYNKVTPTEDDRKLEAAKAHLATAIETYKKALAAKPDDTTIMLGLAWCQDQAGEKEAAIAGYRKVAAAAWEKESKSDGGFGNFLYVETAALSHAAARSREGCHRDCRTKEKFSNPACPSSRGDTDCHSSNRSRVRT